MNKKGLMAVEIAYLATAFVLTTFSLLPSTREDFQKKKAEKLCQSGYKGITCSDVDSMTKDQILAYVKDDITVPQFVMRERLGG